MFECKPLTKSDFELFEGLFTAYYQEMGCEDNVPHLLDEYIFPDLAAGLIFCDLLLLDSSPVGFCIYQKDDIDNEWNFWEGKGDIREIYIDPEHRLMGGGSILLFAAETRLKKLGVNEFYCLPTPNSVDFFRRRGYFISDRYSEDMQTYAFTKP